MQQNKQSSRIYSPWDCFITEIDTGLKTLFGITEACHANPARVIAESQFSPSEKKRVTGYFRVDHSGEVCAQALYRGQAIFVRNPDIKLLLKEAEQEEKDHLSWTYERLQELGARTSLLNVYGYVHAFFLGMFFSFLGDDWNLGFVEETEKQVGAHLQRHIESLPEQDKKSQIILEKMQEDELRHSEVAHNMGARQLPAFIKMVMYWQSKVMTTLAFYF